MRCIVYSPHWLWTILSFVVKSDFYMRTRGVGLLALLVSTSIGNYVSICADQFIVRKGSYLDTYDAWGKKISSRVAR